MRFMLLWYHSTTLKSTDCFGENIGFFSTGFVLIAVYAIIRGGIYIRREALFMKKLSPCDKKSFKGINYDRKKKRLITTILGPACFALCILALPKNLFNRSAYVALGTLVWMGVWWVTLPVHTGVTGFVPIIVNAFFCIVPICNILTKYANETIFLLIGADLVSQSWTVTGLDKRISLKSLYMIGPYLTQQVIVWFLVAAVLSMFLPNMVVTAMLAPIALAMLRYVGEGNCKTSVIASILLLCIVWGADIGGMGTPLGGAMNLVAVDYLEKLTGQELLYKSWFIRLMPLLLAVVLVDLLCILIIKSKKKILREQRNISVIFTGSFRT